MIAVALMLASAPSSQVMTYGCRMNECSWFKEKSRSVVLRNRDGKLIRFITLEGTSRHPDDKYPTRYSPRLRVRFKETTSYVFCSHSRPAVAFHVADGPRGSAIAGIDFRVAARAAAGA